MTRVRQERTTAAPARSVRSGRGRKVRKTLTLDPDLLEAFGSDPGDLSAAVNEVLRAEVERRERQAALARFVADLDERFGEPDPAEVERFRRALA